MKRALAILPWAIAAAGLAAPAPSRVIALSPNLTESVCALGAAGQLVGISDFCQYPPQVVAQKKRCGGWSNPNFEVMSALQPDLILVLGQHQKVQAFGQERGITVKAVTMDNMATIVSGLRELGQALGRESEATSLTTKMETEIAALRKELQVLPPAKRPVVFVSIGRTPGSLAGIHTAAQGSFLDEMLTLAGGRNAFGDVKQYYPQAAKESIVMRRPDIILELTGGAPLTSAQRTQLVADWQALPSIPAVKNHRVLVLDEDYLLIPGPRLLDIVKIFRQALHPAPAGAAKAR